MLVTRYDPVIPHRQSLVDCLRQRCQGRPQTGANRAFGLAEHGLQRHQPRAAHRQVEEEHSNAAGRFDLAVVGGDAHPQAPGDVPRGIVPKDHQIATTARRRWR